MHEWTVTPAVCSQGNVHATLLVSQICDMCNDGLCEREIVCLLCDSDAVNHSGMLCL